MRRMLADDQVSGNKRLVHAASRTILLTYRNRIEHSVCFRCRVRIVALEVMLLLLYPLLSQLQNPF